MSSPFDFTSRYGAHPPDMLTACQGRCEGMGLYPIERNDMTASREEIAAWAKAHDRCSFFGRVRSAFRLGALWRYGPAAHWDVVTAPCDGWHFIKCQDCGGSGKREPRGPREIL